MNRIVRKQLTFVACLTLYLNGVLARAADSPVAFQTPDQAAATVLHSQAPEHMPFFITKPGGTDWLMVFTAIVLIVAVLGFGNIFWKLHTLPERIAHKSEKFQFEIIAILGLIALFTHQHIFWVIGLILAFVEFPDFSTPMGRIATSLETIAGSTGALAKNGEEVSELEPAKAEIQRGAETPLAWPTIPDSESAAESSQKEEKRAEGERPRERAEGRASTKPTFTHATRPERN